MRRTTKREYVAMAIATTVALGAASARASDSIPIDQPTGKTVTGVLVVEKTDIGHPARARFDAAAIKAECEEIRNSPTVSADEPTFEGGQAQDGTGEEVTFRTEHRIVQLKTTRYYLPAPSRQGQWPRCSVWKLQTKRTLNHWRYEGGQTIHREIDLSTGKVREMRLDGLRPPFGDAIARAASTPQASEAKTQTQDKIAGYACRNQSFALGPMTTTSCLAIDDRLPKWLQGRVMRTATSMGGAAGFSSREIIALELNATMDTGVFESTGKALQ